MIDSLYRTMSINTVQTSKFNYNNTSKHLHYFKEVNDLCDNLTLIT